MESSESTQSAKSGSDNSCENSGKKTSHAKVAGWFACLLWVLSLALSFAVPTSSSYIWLPDAVLLLGFFPLLFICPYSFVWISFGLLTAFIGSFLLLLTNIPDTALPADTHGIKAHLAEYHPCWTWMILGLLATFAGFVKLAVNLILFICSKLKNRKLKETAEHLSD